jgi:hypothetical protein
MGMAPIDRSYDKRMLGSNITWECALPIIDTEQDARDLELATTFLITTDKYVNNNNSGNDCLIGS